jgi:hypothetical protein
MLIERSSSVGSHMLASKESEGLRQGLGIVSEVEMVKHAR